MLLSKKLLSYAKWKANNRTVQCKVCFKLQAFWEITFWQSWGELLNVNSVSLLISLDLATELNEARHKGRYPQHKPPRLLCLDQRVLIYNSEDENSGEETQAALSADISDRSDFSCECHQIKTRPMASSETCFPFPTLLVTLITMWMQKKSTINVGREKKTKTTKPKPLIRPSSITEWMQVRCWRTAGETAVEMSARKVVQYSGLLLKCKHKSFAASGMRGTDTLF